MADPANPEPPEAEKAAHQPARSPLDALFAVVSGMRLRSIAAGISLVLLAAALIVVLAVAPEVRLPLWPFETKGRIFVESPEVYTRERLVNDRYDQDFWLHEQLAELDKSVNLFAKKRSEMLDVWYGTRTDAPLSPPSELAPPPFEKEFELRSAMRDRIRQLILENLLDDRHDLTGNTLYGLKFDTTVIPGTNTHRRAFVRVTVEIDPVPRLDQIPEFFQYRMDQIEDHPTEAFRKLPERFRRWQKSVESRLNSFILALPQTVCDGPLPEEFGAAHDPAAMEKESILLALSGILHIDRRDVRIPDNSFRIIIPEPWSEYFLINIESNNECAGKPRLTVEPVFNSVILANESTLREYHPNFERDEEFNKEFFPVARVDLPAEDEDDGETKTDTYAILAENISGEAALSLEQYESMRLKTPVTPKSLRYLLKGEGEDLHGCGEDGGRKCFGQIYFIASGFINFITKLSESDAYSYAVFPRQDVTGMMAESAVRSALDLSRGKDGPSDGGVLASRMLQEARTVSRVINFADGRDRDSSDQIDFGWVTADPDVAEPAQFSQLVLVSVPAYVDRLVLRVTTGWLDRQSREHPESIAQPMSIRLPPDYEAFDTLVREGDERYGPAIYKTLMDPLIVVRACEPADILIPGARLWRSTTVTLGGQPAKKIMVLPNMRGIIASFKPVNMPSVPDIEALEAGEPFDAPLMVWTSEGVDSVRGMVKVLAPKSGACPE